MPCEGCSSQFTVFKRKRNCVECRRFYCNQCLIKRNHLVLCERCLVFTKRPLQKTDLQKLKAKDLIFYLQSKHISTTGCVEKDELVSLILIHVNSSSNSCKSNNSRNNSNTSDSPKHNNPDGDNSNPFNQLKQSCQNFFSTVTEKIASEISFADTKPHPTSPSSSSNSSTRQQQSNIYDQPRIITREIPTYSSSLNNSNISTKNQQAQETPSSINKSQPNNSLNLNSFGNQPVPNNSNSISSNPASTLSSPPEPNCISKSNSISNTPTSSSSPILSLSSISSQSISSQQQQQNVPTLKEQTPISKSKTNLTTKTSTKSVSDNIPAVHRSSSANNRKIFENVFINNCGTNSGGNSSGCECSDDEIITTFQIHQQTLKEKKCSPTTSPQCDSAFEEHLDEPCGESDRVISSSVSKSSSTSTNKNQDFDESSGSSFEELGAVGGSGNKIVDAVKGNGNQSAESGSSATTNSSDTENWQIINNDSDLKNININNETSVNLVQLPSKTANNLDELDENCSSTSAVATIHNNLRFNGISPMQRRIIRRRSDGFIYNYQNRSTNDELFDYGIASCSGRNISRVDEEDSDEDEISGADGITNSVVNEIPLLRKRLKKSCKKCGKTKKNLKRHVAKFKKDLESKKLSDIEIQEELKSFLEFLECRQKSFDCSEDSESNSELLTEAELRQRVEDNYEERFLNDDDGIHVYAHDDDSYDNQLNQSRFDSRFIGLTDFRSLEEFDELTVKQLKEILMLNRVDFKGCCEKQELLERVYRLWKNLQESPAVDKLQVDDLCKICMDAPIECVILECGHMATCTSCGKVLSECPICRQYIVRVVRFFRA